MTPFTIHFDKYPQHHQAGKSFEVLHQHQIVNSVFTSGGYDEEDARYPCNSARRSYGNWMRPFNKQ